MPRIRSIKPQFWLDDNLATICRDARLLFIGLWNMSDDYGVFEWRPKKLKMQIFPYDSDVTANTIEEWLELLQGLGNITNFEHKGKKYGYIPGLNEHQVIKKPSQWRFAPPPADNQFPTSFPPVLISKRKSKKPKGEDKRMSESDSFTNCHDKKIILEKLLDSFRYDWGIVGAKKTRELHEADRELTRADIIPRELKPIVKTEMMVLAQELSVPGCPLEYIPRAFQEAVEQNNRAKLTIRYIRGILFRWLGIKK